ncbi:serine/threonine-protein kinase [Streptomyces yerevanensis]|uniref:serine/threonine-protein kinase n=1 Tax=Streptomyces yerevanensis TaxID=66378 RepID=UPI0005244A1A|nr:serine/threonine-protein kinase [Streptomyces yerevanensis]
MAGEQERVIAGRYRLRQRLGSGGMGSVWRAEDQELRAQVAVKEIEVPVLPDEASGDRASRGRKEALKAAQLREHPNVITVYDVVEHEGLPWIVMEYLPGTMDLSAVVRERGPLPADEVARIGAAALDGLAAGHRLGIIHRDVKPSNILLAPDHAGLADRRVLLTDYGISLRPRETRLTRSGVVIGTPGYMAPERVHGGEATPASDLFSLGVTLYFAVEGAGPFDRDAPEAALMALLETEPSPPQRAGERLSRVIMGLLAKNPLDRTQAAEAAELLTEAAAAGDGTSVPVPAATPEKAATPEEAAASEAAVPEEALRSDDGDAAGDGDRDITPTRTGPEMPPRIRGWRLPALLALVGVLVAAGGFGVGAAVYSDDGQRQRPEARQQPKVSVSPTPTPTTTRSPFPYGTQVGLKDGLMPGQCVDADWKEGEYKGQPELKLVNCEDDDPEGQVITTVASGTGPASGASSEQTQCAERTEKLRKTMPDPVLHVLPPAAGQSQPPDTACLLFLKKATIGGPLGEYRTQGEETSTTQLGPGDCFNTKDEDNGWTPYLASCDEPHHEQAVGWTWSSGNDSSESVDMGALCEEKYGVNWARGKGHAMDGWSSTDDEWNAGFRWVLCTVYQEDGKKLPAGALKPAY